MTLTQDTIKPVQLIPPLENGDRLTRSEFERRYHTMPDVKKADLIEGIVYMASPVRIRSHGKPHAYIMGWLATYESATLGVELADNTTVRLDADNEPQPDALLRIENGGQSRISEDDYVEGAPELHGRRPSNRHPQVLPAGGAVSDAGPSWRLLYDSAR